MLEPSAYPVSRAVILAAGTGSRLGPHTRETPKPLLPIKGRPLIDYTLDALDLCGIGEALVVTGYREAQLREALVGAPVALSFVSNRRYREQASHSLRAARDYCGDEPFLLLMSDHLVSPGLLATLISQAVPLPPVPAVAALDVPDLRQPLDATFVAADFGTYPPAYVDEATRLAIDPGGYVTAIGKELPGWQAIDCGAFVCSPHVWAAADAVPEDCTLSTIFAELACRNRLRAADVTGNFWYDVDTEEDRITAEALLGASQALHG